MSALPRQPGGVYTGLRLTADEYLALGETDERYELIDGVVCMSPSPSRRHQKIVQLLQRQLEAFVDQNSHYDYYAGVDVRFSSDVVLCPDVACFHKDRLPPLNAPLNVAPDLTVEVLSPGNRTVDLTRKRSLYERFGVREYWVIDPIDGSIRCFRLREGGLHETLVAGDSLASEALQGFTFDLRPLRALAADA